MSFIWDHGDGVVTTERYNDHVYTMAGRYVVYVTVIDQYGNEWTSAGQIVRVYDQNYSDGGGSGITDECRMVPVTRQHGLGIAEYADSENPGFDWIWPPSGKASTCKMRNSNGLEVGLVLDSKTMGLFQINDATVWTDRRRVAYGGAVTRWKSYAPAVYAIEGEHITVKHIEGHVYLKPYDRSKRNTAGYDQEGFPVELRVDLGVLRNGEPDTLEAQTVRVPKDGDIVLSDEFDSRTLQTVITIYGAPAYMTGLEALYDFIDKAAVPVLRRMAEEVYFTHLSQDPLFEITRERTQPLLNGGTGAEATGTVAGTFQGPDGFEDSALLFVAPNYGITDVMPEEAAFDYSFMLWVNQVLAGDLPLRLWDIGNLHIDIVAGWILQINDGVNPVVNVNLGFNGFQWSHIAVVRQSLYHIVYENGELLGQYALNTVENYGTAVVCCDLAPCGLFHAVGLPRGLTADELAFYYDDVTRKAGRNTLPPF